MLFIFLNLVVSNIFDSFFSVSVYMLRHHEEQYYIPHIVQLGCSISAVNEQHYSD